MVMIYILIALELDIFQKKLKNSWEIKMSENINRTQAYYSIMCEYFCNRFNDLILKGKSLLDYTYLFSPIEYEKNDKKILTYFQ